MSKLLIENKSGVLVLHYASDYLDLSFKEAVEAFIDSDEIPDNARILFNLEENEALNSYGVSAFIMMFRHLDKKNGVLALCCFDKPMMKITLRITGVIALYDQHVYTTEEDAISALKKL